MNTTKRITHAIIVLALAGMPFAQAEEAQPPAIVEAWTCSYNDGKGYSDLMGARDYLVRQAGRAGLPVGPAYTWSLYKGDPGFDFVWLSPHANMGAFAAAADAGAGEEALAGVGERFDAVARCTAGFGAIRQVFEREGAEPDGDTTLVSASGCRLRQGVGAADIADLSGHIADVMTGLGNNAPNAAYAISPVTGGPTSPDLVLFTVNNNMTAYANFVGSLFGSEEGASLGRHFNAVADCSLALWTGQQVIEAPEGE